MSQPTSVSRPASATLGQRLRSLGVGGRRLKRGWTRQRFGEVLRTLAYVAPLTFLIWVWAQDQQIDSIAQRSIQVRIEHWDSGKVVILRGSTTGERLDQANGAILVDLTFQGPRIGLNSVIRTITENPTSALLEIRLRRDAGEATISLRDELSQLELLREAGVTVREASPSHAIIGIENRAQVEARIVADKVSPEDLAGPVEFDPPTVLLSGPASALKDLPVLDGVATMLAKLPDTPAGEQDVPVTIEVPGAGNGVRPETVVVKAHFNRRERREETLVLPFPVQVFTSLPAALAVAPEGLSPVVNGVRVRGPAHVISRLRITENQDDPLRAQIRAVVALDRDDEQRIGQQVTRDVRLELPDGLVPDGELPKVTFTVRRVDSI